MLVQVLPEYLINYEQRPAQTRISIPANDLTTILVSAEEHEQDLPAVDSVQSSPKHVRISQDDPVLKPKEGPIDIRAR